MKTTHLLSLCIALTATCAFGQLPGNKAENIKFPGWHTDLEVAKAEAVAQNAGKTNATDLRKLVYLCIYDDNNAGKDTRNKLFLKEKFKQFAKDNFVLCVLDVTIAKNMDAKTTDAIIEIRKKYNVADDAIPQIHVLRQDGATLMRMEYHADKTPGELDYLASLRDFLAKRDIRLNEDALRGYKPNKTPPTPSGSGKGEPKTSPEKPKSAFEKLKEQKDK